ncbi:Nitric oxide -responding transcriptional regulator Dnr (Crp/Fnr family) [Georgfuchsia toluolica]|uniref:Nitric oxide -responding transcriptional regulator Dnr (Crp/Fnr family) n=1 Tax=Georgfuchsia toluolica TaxID=424218 RepID=A0A916J642_9PROT|nr:Crp/Fnr family transcriptional regulator [Georgfuchsia toluolica]CAG4883116.1 Nitric oxide -responding transcriptional regulator Dnr (Crp/Fnr family) [Georgfuchsia toluolica]
MNQPANADNTHKILSHLPLFQALKAVQLQRIADGTSELRLEKGDTLFHKGDPSDGFYVVIFGQIKLTIGSAQGNEKVVEIIGQRQSFGEAMMFLDRSYPVTAVALSDSLLLHVKRSDVEYLLSSDPSFARGMLAGLSLRLHSLIKDVESYTMRSSTQRVLGYLLQHCAEDEALTADIALPASKQVVASRLNLTPETFSRILNDLTRAGLIEVQGRTVCIPDLRRLREFEI